MESHWLLKVQVPLLHVQKGMDPLLLNVPLGIPSVLLQEVPDLFFPVP